jgi:hypothetical protein
VRQDQIGLGQTAAFQKKPITPAVQPISGIGQRRNCVVAGGFEAKSKRPVTAQIDKATIGVAVRQRLGSGPVLPPVPGAEKRDYGSLAIRRNARAEAALVLVDQFAELILDVHAPGPFLDRALTDSERHARDSATPRTILQPA